MASNLIFRPSAVTIFQQLERDSFRKRHTLYHQKRPESALDEDDAVVGKGAAANDGLNADNDDNEEGAAGEGKSASSLVRSKHSTEPDLAAFHKEHQQPLHHFDSLPKNFRNRARGNVRQQNCRHLMPSGDLLTYHLSEL